MGFDMSGKHFFFVLLRLIIFSRQRVLE